MNKQKCFKLLSLGWLVISSLVAIIEINEDREGDGKLGQIRLTGQVRSGLRTDDEI